MTTRVAVNGVALAVDDVGSGPVVCFSHGLLWSRAMFAPQIAALSDRYRCISWDHRGQGESTVPPGRVVTIESCYEDAVALLDALGLDQPVHFVGLSMGGFVGARLAARNPERVRSLTLMASAGDPEPAANVGKYRRMAWVARWLGVRGFLVDRVMPIMFGQSFLDDPDRAAERARLRAALLALRPSIHKAVTGVIERDAVLDELGAIRCPTQLLHGEQDKAIAMARAEDTARRIPGARLVRIPGAGHTSTLEAPGAITDALAAFLARVDQPS